MRVEKGFPSWGADLSPDYGSFEPGLGRFVRLDKSDFIGKAVAQKQAAGAPRERLASFVIEADGTDCFGGEAVYRDGELAGYVTSGSYGHRLGESLALGYVKDGYCEDGAALEVEVVGRRRPARLSTRPRYDPDGARMRS
jgi:dimethylglycine dehydrogenase